MIDVSRYIGLPYRVEGRGPDAYDCWGLIQAVYRDLLGVELPDYCGYEHTMTPETAGMIHAARPGWHAVDKPKPLDVVLLNVSGQPNHIGLIIGPSTMLHTTHTKDACIESLTRPAWARRIEGYYRRD